MSLVAEHHSDETVTFSSTYIRSCVDAGDVVAAAEALGRPHRVEGVVVRGDGRGQGAGLSDRQRRAADVFGDPGRRRVRRLVHRARPRPGGRHRRPGRALPGRGVGRHQPDVLRAHPHRRGVRPGHRRPTCTASTSRWTSSPASAARRSSTRWPTWSTAMGGRHRAGPHDPVGRPAAAISQLSRLALLDCRRPGACCSSRWPRP